MITDTLNAIKATFLADTAIAGPVGNRVHNFEAPQETAAPYIVYSITSTAEEHALPRGRNAENAWRFTLDIQIVDEEKKTHALVASIADAVIARLLREELDFTVPQKYAYNIRLSNFSQSTSNERPVAVLTFTMSVATI